MSELTEILADDECGRVVAASIARDRILAGRDGYNGSPPDVLLVEVERILAERTQALRDEVEQERERANSNFDQALALRDEVEQLREERDYHHARFDVLRAKLGGTVSLRGVPAGSYWAEWHRTHCAAAEAATRAEAQLTKLRQDIEALAKNDRAHRVTKTGDDTGDGGE